MSNKTMELKYEKLAPGIFVYENVMDDTDVFLKNIKNALDNGSMSWYDDSTVLKNGEEVSNKEVRDLSQLSIPYKISKFSLNSHATPHQAFNNVVGNRLYTSLTPLEKHYSLENNNIETFAHDEYYIFKYQKDSFFADHVDDGMLFPRVISLVFYMNDDYEGGEIEFPEFDIKHKPKKNTAIIFPSNFVYHHRVNPVLNGTRYCVTTWLMYKDYPKKEDQ